MGSEIRKAKLKDLDAIGKIYNYEVMNSTATFDTKLRTKKQLLEWFHEHRTKYCIIVCENNNEIVGWASTSRWSDRLAYRFTAENSVYVRKDFRGKGIGRRLLSELIKHSVKAGFHTIIARIAEGNQTSIKMHSESGFETIGIMKEVGLKFNKYIDVTLMQKLLQKDP